MIRIRIPGKDDKYILQLVRKELLPHTRREMPHVEYDPALYKQRLAEGATFVVTKSNKSQPLGFITLLEVEDILFIDMLAVHRGCQGNGLGSKLIQWAERYAKKSGLANAQLLVEQGNKKAQKFYSKKGYRQLDYIPEQRCFLLNKPL